MTAEAESVALFMLTGIQAAGKTTVAHHLAMRFDKAVFIEGDVVRRMVVRGRLEMNPDPSPEVVAQLITRYRAQAALAACYLEAGFTVVVEDVVIGPYLRDYLDAFATVLPPAVAGNVHLVVLAPDPAAVAEREVMRDKDAYTDDWTVQSLDQILREETPRLGLWLDSSRLTVEQTVDAVLAQRADARLGLPVVGDGDLPAGWVESLIRGALANRVGAATAESLPADMLFAEAGIDSIVIVYVVAEVERRLQRALPSDAELMNTATSVKALSAEFLSASVPSAREG